MRGAVSGNTGLAKNGVSNPYATKQNFKRSTPDYSSSSLEIPKDRLFGKRHENKNAGVEGKAAEGRSPTSLVKTCRDLVDGFEAVLVSVEASITKVDDEVRARKPGQSVINKLTMIDNKVAQVRKHMDAAKTTKYKTKETVDELVSTAADLNAKLGKYKNALGEATSNLYKDLAMNAGNIQSYVMEYVEKSCVTAA